MKFYSTGNWGQLYKTFYGRNLLMFLISWSIFPQNCGSNLRSSTWVSFYIRHGLKCLKMTKAVTYKTAAIITVVKGLQYKLQF